MHAMYLRGLERRVQHVVVSVAEELAERVLLRHAHLRNKHTRTF